jgi:hypothetical protein
LCKIPVTDNVVSLFKKRRITMVHNKVICPYLLGNPDGVMCDAAVDFIRNIKDINLDICMSRHFESCHVYYSKLQELSNLPITEIERARFNENAA